jgi:hypothetical protein
MRLTIYVLVGLCACALGCGEADEPVDSGGDTSADAPDLPLDLRGDTGDVQADQGDVRGDPGDEPDVPGPGRPQTVLVVDYEMRPAFLWSPVLAALTEAGWEPVYRRFYPHITPADADTYGMIVLASGRAPSTPAARMRAAEVDHLERFARDGGALVLLPENGWADAAFAENEWFFFNRLLERIDVPVRTARATLIGAVWPPDGDRPPLHEETLDSYPGALEWTLDLPVVYPDTQHAGVTRFATPFAAGWVPPLVCEGEDVAVLAGARLEVTVWQTLGQGEGQLAFPIRRVPVAVLGVGPARAPVLVLPASIALLPAHTERQSDEPLLDARLFNGTGTFLKRVLLHTAAVALDPDKHDPRIGCNFTLDDGLFTAVADGFPASSPVATTVPALVPPSELPVPAVPDGPVLEGVLAPAPSDISPPWFRDGKAHLAYGDWDAELGPQFENGREHGVDAFMIYLPPDWVRGERDPRLGELAATAAQAQVHLFIGTIAVSLFDEALRASAPRPLGRNGQQVDVPSPLSDEFWDGAIRPFVLGAARAASENPGITGVQLDLELYGAGPLSLHRGHILGDAEWEVIVSAVPDAEDVPENERFPWLVDAGHMRTATAALRDAVAARARALRDEAWEIHPDLELMIYSLDATTGWFYEGLLAGLSTAERPVTWLTYDVHTAALREDLAARGVHVRMVGGVLGVRLTPEDLGSALATARGASDGYWLFKLQDFPPGDDHPDAPRLHGTPTDYWDEVGRASAP